MKNLVIWYPGIWLFWSFSRDSHLLEVPLQSHHLYQTKVLKVAISAPAVSFYGLFIGCIDSCFSQRTLTMLVGVVALCYQHHKMLIIECHNSHTHSQILFNSLDHRSIKVVIATPDLSALIPL